MKKIFKKSLALAVSAALCLTALVGCLTVSAAGTATASISSVEVANGSTSATITVTIGSANDQVAAARFNLVAAEGITLNTNAFDSTITNGDGYTGNGFTVISNGNMFLLEAENEVLASAASFDIPVTIADGTTAATYAVSFGDVLEVANYGTYDSTTQTWSNDEVLLTVSSTNGGVTVAEAAATEPVLDSNVTFMTRSATIQDTLGIGYVVLKSKVADYSRFEVVATATKYDTARNTYVAEPVVLTLDEKTAFYVATYSGIAMFELDLPVTTFIKCYDAEGNYVAYSESVTDTPAALLKATYNGTGATVATKTLVTDALNLGAAAQAYFAVAGSDLASATPINEGWDQTYATTGELSGLTVVNNAVWADDSPLTSADITVTPSMNLAATPTVGYLIRDVKGSLDASKLSLTVSYNVQYPTAFAGVRNAVVSGSQMTKVGSFYTYAFDKMTLADSNRTITATLSYDGAEVLTYSYTMDAGIQTYAGNSNPNTAALSVSLGRFEASARAYFGA